MKEFNAKQEIENVINWIREWFENNGPQANAVIGISGGKDSAIVATLLVKALGKDRVTGVMMPNGVQKDISDSKRIVEYLGIKAYTVNIEKAYNGIIDAVSESGLEIKRDSEINTPPRLRMTTLYAIAQSLPNGGRVVNTCNRSEDYVGYSTKFGDSAGDMSPCSDFLVCEMLQIGEALGLPKEFIYKTPSDGLSGLSDEDKLGFTYAVLDHYVLTGEIDDEETKQKIDRLHKINLHKLELLPQYKQSR